jgi:hypothetical protein
MSQPESAHELLDCLRSAIGLLELDRTTQLHRDVTAVSDHLVRPSFRIAVFAPFNYGKSTLLNALLGERTLPIDLIPTTGAAITVRYGTALQTQIQFSDGRSLTQPGTEILKQFAILDDDRRMRQDVAAVEVQCPHPFLETGVELVDLPGTDDREAQDALVKNQLLGADLVVQLLDGRKLMTLGEREHLRDWLLDRGIETVIFVVNFLNLMEPEDQKQVQSRLRFVAESFRAKLPAGISNLYRVDALPALRARLKGDAAAVQTSGLPMLESALQTIVHTQRQQTEARIPRIKAIAHQIRQLLQQKVDQVRADQTTSETTHHQKAQIKQQAEQLIRKGFSQSVQEFREWLSLSQLLDRYHYAAAEALQQGTLAQWQKGEFKTTAIDHQQAVAKWVHQACDFFSYARPHQLLIQFPSEPIVLPTNAPTPSTGSKLDDYTPAALATGLGWMLGGPVGGAILGGASYLLNKTLDSDKSTPPTAISVSLYDCLEAMREYFVNFSSLNLVALTRYEQASERSLKASAEPTEITQQDHQLGLLRSTLERLDEILRSM